MWHHVYYIASDNILISHFSMNLSIAPAHFQLKNITLFISTYTIYQKVLVVF